jgi:hypothetical protein
MAPGSTVANVLTFELHTIDADVLTDLYLVVAVDNRRRLRDVLEQQEPLFTRLQFYIGENEAQMIDEMVWSDFIHRGSHRSSQDIYRYAQSSQQVPSIEQGVYKVPLWFCQERSKDGLYLLRIKTKIWIRVFDAPLVRDGINIRYSLLAETLYLDSDQKTKILSPPLLQQAIRFGVHTTISLSRPTPRYKINLSAASASVSNMRISELYITNDNPDDILSANMATLVVDMGTSKYPHFISAVGGVASDLPRDVYSIPGIYSFQAHTGVVNVTGGTLFFSFPDRPEASGDLETYFQSFSSILHDPNWFCTLEVPKSIQTGRYLENTFLPQTLGLLFICYGILEYSLADGCVTLRPPSDVLHDS